MLFARVGHEIYGDIKKEPHFEKESPCPRVPVAKVFILVVLKLNFNTTSIKTFGEVLKREPHCEKEPHSIRVNVEASKTHVRGAHWRVPF